MGMTDDNNALWEAMHEIRDRVTRIEERSISRDEKIAGMATNVQEMHTFFVQSQGGFKVANTMTKFAYGFGGVVFTFAISNWEWVKRLFKMS
jgi:hypothetical protein